MSVLIRQVAEPLRTLSFQYGDERIKFERLPRGEGINRVLIKVHPDCRVQVSAPEQADDEAVLAAVKKRGRWIFERVRNFRSRQTHITPRKYVSGESTYYLGKQYQLKVVQTIDVPQAVKLLRGSLEIIVRKDDTSKVAQLLNAWYFVRAKDVFSKRLDALLDQTLWVESKPPLRVLNMQTQWGSCSPKGRLTLNPHLVKAPRECIDYVILHELCHIAEHNHSDRFYRLMRQVMPDWEKTKKRLDGMANLLLR